MKISASHGSAGRIFCGAGKSAVRREGLGTEEADRHGRVSGRRGEGTPPYGRVIRGAVGGAMWASPPTDGYKRCGAVRNPPVTASPCQPPLGKRAYKDGGADCHSRCAHWLRNDMVFCKGCGANPGGRTGYGWCGEERCKKRQRGGAAFMLFRPGSP